MAAITMESKPRPWWLTLVGGILALVIGGILLWAPAKTKVDTYLILVAILGLYWMIEGFLDIVSIFSDHTAWGWKLFMGIIGILAGAYILMYPVASGLSLPRIFVLVLGLWGLFQGIVLLVLAFQGGGWGAGIAGVLGIIFGGILMANYTALGAGLSLLWVAAIAGVIGGVIMIIMAIRQRSESI
jgi:uncharacterized membrane protein HdeD (DUF308 family)